MNRNIGVLISGRGSNLQAIIDAIRDGRLDARIAVVISNRADADGLERARQAGIETVVRDHKAWPSREAYEAVLVDDLRARDVGLVCLAGFMRLLGATFVGAFPNRILNIHPALLPSFPGLHAQRQARRARREDLRRDRAPRRHEPRRRADRHAGRGAGARRRHRGHARRAHPRRGAPHLPGSDSTHPGRRDGTVQGRRLRFSSQ